MVVGVVGVSVVGVIGDGVGVGVGVVVVGLGGMVVGIGVCIVVFGVVVGVVVVDGCCRYCLRCLFCWCRHR